MEEDNDKPILKQANSCEECKSNPSKYKCPGCNLRSCSLPCVQAHKKRTGCNGKRNRTQAVPLSEFNDNILLSDFFLLEETERVVDSAKRRRSKLCGFYDRWNPPLHLKRFVSAASSRGTKLILLPCGMLRRKKNQSKYDKGNKLISWTIEWRFHGTNVVLHDHGVNENTSLSSTLEKHLIPGPWINELRPFCLEQLNRLRLFIHVLPKDPKSPFKELDINAPIRKQLANVVILEFPVIYVMLPSPCSSFEVIKDVNHKSHESLPEDFKNNQSVEGVPLREEEIEDDEFEDPEVLDVMKEFHFGQPHKMPQNSSEYVEATNYSQDEPPVVPGLAAGSPSNSSLETKELEFPEGMDFDFDDSLLDSYPLPADFNCSDLFDDFMYSEPNSTLSIDEGELCCVQRVDTAKEELEEGEIGE